MYLLIVLLPLAGFLFAGLFGRAFAPRVSELVTSGFVVVGALLSWLAFFSVGLGSDPARSADVMTWIQSGSLEADWSLRIDTLTVVMLVVVNTVSALVHIYSIGYMAHDPGRPRFFAYLSFFTFAMLTLVTADNLIQLFFGWEGVGLASYLLIGFWYNRPSANAAAMKAFIVNRVGDFGFALGIFGVFLLFGSVNFTEIFVNAEAVAASTEAFDFFGWSVSGTAALSVVCLLLFMGAMGKSAQVPLHTWLPDAMEGPTPVSALIHAATMVTAGVFLVARMSPLFELAPAALPVVVLVGATTALFAATVGLVQNDIKRVIAYSTCSQLGYMFVALGVGAYGAAIFHLFTHAFFKALLFLGAGSVIHAMSDEQDMRRMGGLRKEIPRTYWMMVIGTLALTGFPFTAGFYSKDAIIESAFAAGGESAAYETLHGIATYGFIMTAVAAVLTAFYSWRLIFMTFHGRSRARSEVMSHVHESPPSMLVPLYVLAAGALLAGILFSNLFIGDGEAEFWKDALYTVEGNEVLDGAHHAPSWVKLLPPAAMLVGFLVAYLFYIARPEAPKRLARDQPLIHRFLLNKWYFDELFNWLLVRPAFRFGRFLWRQGDGKVIDGFGPDGVAARVLDLTNRVVRLQTGYLYHYAFAMLIGIALLITFMMFAN